MGIRNYNYDSSFAPKGKTVLQSFFPQNENDYDYWQQLYISDKEKYNEMKKAKAEEILKNLLLRYPQLENKITTLNIITPCTYNNFAGAYKGSYMGFVYVPQESMAQNVISGIISGLDNVVIGTQWQQLPGGLPIAVTMGKFAAQRVANKEWSN